MGELSRQEMRQLEMLIRTEIGKSYELVILPRLQSVDGKLDTLLEAKEEHRRRIERLEIWRDGFDPPIQRQGRFATKGVVSVLLLTVALLLSLAAALLLLWLNRIPG